MQLVIVVDSISFQLPITQLPISAVRVAVLLGLLLVSLGNCWRVVVGGSARLLLLHEARLLELLLFEGLLVIEWLVVVLEGVLASVAAAVVVLVVVDRKGVPVVGVCSQVDHVLAVC